MIDPKAEPIGHRPPYKPIDVSGRKPVQQAPTEPHTFVLQTRLPSMNWRELARIATVDIDTE